MRLSDLRKRDNSARRSPPSRGDESLVPDRRGGMRSVDCIERKLGSLLRKESVMAPGRFPHSISTEPSEGRDLL